MQKVMIMAAAFCVAWSFEVGAQCPTGYCWSLFCGNQCIQTYPVGAPYPGSGSCEACRDWWCEIYGDIWQHEEAEVGEGGPSMTEERFTCTDELCDMMSYILCDT
jgi:hypothetical protein